MILLVTRKTLERDHVRSVSPDELERVLPEIHRDECERIVVDGLDAGINPFALARRLRSTEAPPLVLAGALRDDQRFWAERNGCHVAADLEAAFELEI